MRGQLLSIFQHLWVECDLKKVMEHVSIRQYSDNQAQTKLDRAVLTPVAWLLPQAWKCCLCGAAKAVYKLRAQL